MADYISPMTRHSGDGLGPCDGKSLHNRRTHTRSRRHRPYSLEVPILLMPIKSLAVKAVHASALAAKDSPLCVAAKAAEKVLAIVAPPSSTHQPCPCSLIKQNERMTAVRSRRDPNEPCPLTYFTLLASRSPFAFFLLCLVISYRLAGVGKSCLLLRYSDDQFSGSYISTIGYVRQ